MTEQAQPRIVEGEVMDSPTQGPSVIHPDEATDHTPPTDPHLGEEINRKMFRARVRSGVADFIGGHPRTTAFASSTLGGGVMASTRLTEVAVIGGTAIFGGFLRDRVANKRQRAELAARDEALEAQKKVTRGIEDLKDRTIEEMKSHLEEELRGVQSGAEEAIREVQEASDRHGQVRYTEGFATGHGEGLEEGMAEGKRIERFFLRVEDIYREAQRPLDRATLEEAITPVDAETFAFMYTNPEDEDKMIQIREGSESALTGVIHRKQEEHASSTVIGLQPAGTEFNQAKDPYIERVVDEGDDSFTLRHVGNGENGTRFVREISFADTEDGLVVRAADKRKSTDDGKEEIVIPLIEPDAIVEAYTSIMRAAYH